MKHTVVAKFGGTSVKTASAICQATRIVSANKSIQAVVVSAVGGVTNLLIDLCNSSAPAARKSIVQKILDIHIGIVEEMNLNIIEKIISITKRLNDVIDTNISSEEARDNIVSSGEDLSSIIVHAYFVSQGIKSVHLNARNYLVTNSNFGKATPDLEAIKRYAFPQEMFVTQGFIGSTHDGKTTTLGRGGSDYSAALISEAINAHELLIYTDVPGVYTMDPNIVSEARLIPELNFHEMAEMANFGAKVLHPSTLEPCVRAKVPVRVLSTFEPLEKGTFISVSDDKKSNTNITAITMRKNQVLVTIKSLQMINAYGFLANIFNILAKYEISVDLITTSEVSVALTISNINDSCNSNNFVANQKMIDELSEFADIIIDDRLTLIAVIGSGLNIPGVIQKILGSIEKYTIKLICYGASNSNVSVLVPENEASHIAEKLHSQLLKIE